MNSRWMILVAAIAVFGCADGDEEDGMDTTYTTLDTAAMNEDADEALAGDAMADGQAEGTLLNVNSASVADLRDAGISDAAVAAITAGRPYDDMLAVDAALASVLDESGREAAYRTMWIPIDLNGASREEILLIPGVGDRMAHEFEEYRPYRAMAEFRREIGKYVDDDEVERLAKYVTLE